MTSQPGTRDEMLARFCAEVKSKTRSTGVIAGAIATVGFPTWILFDYLVEPDKAGDFLWIRLGFAVPIALLWLAIAFTELGRRRPELLLLAIMLIVNFGITLMLVQVESHYAAYALGMSLTAYAGAFLLIWPPRYMIALIGISFAMIAIVLLVADPIPADAIGAVAFYFGTASVLSYFGQHHRHANAQREFEALYALEHEQERSRALLEELNRQSHEDSLTGLANRRAWDEALSRECARIERIASPLAVLLCDLDQLKAINDQLGHPVGDLVLKAVAQELQLGARQGDLVARIGGDEFAVLCPDADLLGATELAERLRTTVENEASAAAALGGVSISVGVADWEGEDDSAETMMLRADRRLYRAKLTRNVVCAGDPPRAI